MDVPGILKDVLSWDAQKHVTVKTDLRGNDVLCQSRRENAFAKQTARGNKGLSIGRLKLQVIAKQFDILWPIDIYYEIVCNI